MVPHVGTHPPDALHGDQWTCALWGQVSAEENASIWNCGVHLFVFACRGSVHGAAVEQIPSKYSHCYSGASDGARSFGLKVLDGISGFLQIEVLKEIALLVSVSGKEEAKPCFLGWVEPRGNPFLDKL